MDAASSTGDCRPVQEHRKANADRRLMGTLAEGRGKSKVREDPNVRVRVFSNMRCPPAGMWPASDYTEEVRQFGEEVTRQEPRQPKLMSVTDPAAERCNSRLKAVNDTIEHCTGSGSFSGAMRRAMRRARNRPT